VFGDNDADDDDYDDDDNYASAPRAGGH